MKRILVFLLSCLAFAAAAREAAAQPVSRAVYLLPMRSGLDQFLANHLASTPDLHVVTDAKLADLIMTDRLGPGFEQRLKDLFPPPPEPAPEPPADTDESAAPPPQALVKAPPVGNLSSFSRGKGNVFLVDIASRQVIWSTFEPPDGNASEDLERSAGRIVKKLRKDMQANPPKAVKPPPAAQPAAAPPPAPAK
jgi:hypothetical protein